VYALQPGAYASSTIEIPAHSALIGFGGAVIETSSNEAIVGAGPGVVVKDVDIVEYHNGFYSDHQAVLERVRFISGTRRAIQFGNNRNWVSDAEVTRCDIIGIDGGSASETQGIAMFGQRARITYNNVHDIVNDAMDDCEGIYTKARDSFIIGNILKNAGGKQGAIAIKGNLPLQPNQRTAPLGNVGECSGNIISFTTPGLAGIHIGNDDWLVADNTVKGAAVGVNVATKHMDWVKVLGGNSLHASLDAVRFVCTGSGRINKQHVAVMGNVLEAPNHVVVRHTAEDGGGTIPMPSRVDAHIDGNALA
jgi:hypothetical protein